MEGGQLASAGYMASYMRERSVDALLILRNENKWAMSGNFLYFSCFDMFS